MTRNSRNNSRLHFGQEGARVIPASELHTSVAGATEEGRIIPRSIGHPKRANVYPPFRDHLWKGYQISPKNRVLDAAWGSDRTGKYVNADSGVR